MSEDGNGRPAVVRTERGLAIAGDRITLYDIMDCVTLGWSPERIRDWFNLTDQQIAGVMQYIEAHRAEVEAEYQEVLLDAEAERYYWEERNRDRFTQIATLPPGTSFPEARAKLAAAKAKPRRS